MQTTLLATKFHRPITPAKYVQRPHLIRRLNEGLLSNCQLTLFSAPAGFGKTNCVIEWINGLDRPVTWLSLDPSDDDPVRFFSYFIAALQQVDAKLGREIEAALNTGQLPPVDSITTAFTNDVLSLNRQFLIVLDDFHFIQDRVILQVLEKIIANQPRQVHFVLVTREDPLLPLARLRANNQLAEIRAGDLRFSGSEISQFLLDVMGIPLSDADITSLENRTEGWAAGLQLAGLSMRGRNDPSSFITGLTGSHRYILNYLTEEVLNRQDEEIQTFLLQTSILDELSGDLCDTVTGRSDSGLLLEQLLNANLFLVPLDDELRWYRYHHLFADVLHTLLTRTFKEQINQLHLRASQWYTRAGMVPEAIEHALAAEDYRQAVDLIERHAMRIIMQGYVKTVERWFHTIPPEWHLKSPRANLAFAGMYLMRGNYSMVGQHLEQSEKAIFTNELTFEATPHQNSLRSEWFALQSNLCNVQGKAGQSIEMAMQAIQSAQPGDFYVRGIAFLGLGGAYRLIDDYPKLVDAYQKSIQNSRAAANFLPEMLSVTALVLMAIQHGQLRFAEEVASQVVSRIDSSGDQPPPVAGSVYGALGMVYYEWNQLEKARTSYLRALRLSQLGGHNAGIIFGTVLLSRLYEAEGNLESAAREIQEAVDLLPLGVPAWLKPEVILQRVLINLARRNPIGAEAVLNDLGFDMQAPITRGTELYSLASLRLLYYQARENHQEEGFHKGIDIASRLFEEARQGDRASIILQALLLRAQMHAALNHRSASLDDINLALELAKPEDYIRTFVDEGEAVARLLKDHLAQIKHAGYVERLLAAFTDADAAEVNSSRIESPVLETSTAREEPQALPEPLTERELDVLRLIAEGLKYGQVADQLVISVNTVRFYIKEIYSKLQVNNRTQAVEMARKLKLL